MKAFHTLTAIAAPMPAENIDTDQIIPARFLKYSRAEGYGNFLFHDQRFDQHGGERPGFVLNRPEFRKAQIIVAGPNFGGGSSREGAVYALADYGIRCVIAPSFGQIFYKNCFANGLLAAKADAADIETLMLAVEASDSNLLQVDLEQTSISVPTGGVRIGFEVEPFFATMLLQGVDELGLTLGLRDEISAFEERYFDRFAFLKRAG